MTSVHITLPARAVNAQVRFEYEADLVKLLRSFQGARWESRGRAWTVPMRHLPELRKQLEGRGLTVHIADRRAA